jgi:hypothetical protein
MAKWTGALCFAAFVVVCVIGANRFVCSYNERYRAAQAADEALNADRRMCRMQLGIDYDIHQRALMMACAHEVTAKVAKTGPTRSIAFNAAWNQCMPEMATCERALQP